MRKISILFLSLITLTTLMAEDFEVDGIAYNKLGGDSVEVTSKSPKYSGTINIPSSIIFGDATYRVTSIGNETFLSCTSLTSITIPFSITSIGEDVFASCFALISIDVDTINKKFASIDGVLFNNTKDTLLQYPIGNTRTYYAVPDNVTCIGNFAFDGCTTLDTVNLPASLMSIEDYAFYGCKALSFIKIPSIVTYIGEQAFKNCTKMTYAILPEGLLWLGPWAFHCCYALKSINIPSSLSGISVRAFAYCKSLTSITIPVGVDSIGDAAFDNCTSLDSIQISNSVKSIGGYAFQYCTALSSIALPNSITSIGSFTFRECSSLSSIIIPNNVKSIGTAALKLCTSLTSISIPNNVTSLGNYAFDGCSSLSSITCFATTHPTCGTSCFNDISKSIPIYVPYGSVEVYKTAEEWKEFSNIQAIAAEPTITDTIIVTPSNNSVTITWPTTDGADSYTIVINKGGEPFCTLTFNAQGQLTNIAFAPGRGANNEVAATAVAGGYKFTITSLTPGTKYNYEIDTQNASGTSIANYTGTFTTTGSTDLNQLPDSPVNRFTKIIKDNQLLILRDGKTYNAQGGEIK